MKRRVPGLVKRIMAALSSKTNEFRTRFMIFFLLHRNQTLLLDKFQTVLAGRRHANRLHKVRSQVDNVVVDDDEGSCVDYYCPRGKGEEEEGESFIMYVDAEPTMSMEMSTGVDPTTNHAFSYVQAQEGTPEDSCTELTHALFKESEKEMKQQLQHNEDGASMNTMVNVLEDMENDESSNEEEDEGDEDIDHAADLFIERFRRQILLQRQLSLQERRSSTTTTSQKLQHNA